MHIRPYHSSDLSSMGDVMKAANMTDTLSLFFRRDVGRYPFTDRKGSVRFVKSLLLGIGTYAFVMETDPWDYPLPSDGDSSSTTTGPFTPSIVGWVTYTRSGTSHTAKRWQQQNSTPYCALNRFLMKLEADYYHPTFPSVNHTWDRAKHNSVSHLFWQPWSDIELWEINALFVHPDWQRRGLGQRLIQWGKDRASEERIPVVVDGSAIGGGAYRKAGFQSIVVTGFGEYFDEVRLGGEPMQKWVWEPEGMESVVEGLRGKAEEYKRGWMEKREREGREKV